MVKRQHLPQTLLSDLALLSLLKGGFTWVWIIVFVCTFISSAAAAPVLEVSPITWNIVGLDSNSPANGPFRFPVGARICNTGDTTANNVTSDFAWDDGQGVFVGDVNADPYINLRAGSLSSVAIGSLSSGSCADGYFEVEVTKVIASFDKTRRYHITATDSGSGATGTSPRLRELYVERLISQNRNSVSKVELDGTLIPAGGTMNLLVGNTYEIKLYGGTATQGYEQFEAFINFPNTIFQILSVGTSYSADTSIYVDNPNDKLYADACLWQNDPNNPNYRSCVGAAGKAGGSNVVTTYTVKILSGAGTSQSLNSLLYDFSGSSFHYNADYGVGARIVNILGPDSVTISKSFTPKAISPGGTSTMTIKLNNPTAETFTGVNFTDAFPAGLTVVTTGTTTVCGGSLVTTSNTVSFSGGTMAANSVCTINVTVTAASDGSYPNTTGHLFINTSVDTGNTGTDTLIASSAPACVPGQTLVTWTVPVGSSNPPDTTTGGAGSPTVNNTGFTATASAGVPGSTQIDNIGFNDTRSWLTYGYDSLNNYVQFVVDTRSYTGVQMSFQLQNASVANGPTTMTVSYNNGAGFVTLPAGTLTVPGDTNWTAKTIDFSGLTSTSGATTFRIAASGAKNNNSGAGLNYDVITFTGCGIPAPAPTISKSFSPDPIVKGANATLTFVINNTQPGNKNLTGIAFTDVLPAGLEISTPNGLSGGCGAGTITAIAGTQTISLSGAALTAGTSCNFSVSVKGSAAGNYENTTSFLSTTQTGPTTSYASDTLTVIAPPDLEKSFSPAAILVGETSTLTFWINNPNLTTSLTGISFTDTLPAGLTLATSGPTPTCGGSLTTSAPNVISFSGGSLPANSPCSFDITVTGTTVGSKNNSTSTVSSSEGGEGSAATATLIVSDPQPLLGLNKQISTDGTNWLKFVGVSLPADLYFRFTISNDGETSLGGLSVTDPDITPCALPTSLAIGASASCVVGPLSITSVPTPNPFINTATADSASTNPVTSSARFGTKSLTIQKSADKSSFAAIGELLTYSYLVANDGGYPLLEPLTVSDDKSTDEACPSVNTVGDLDTYLDPGESLTCTATYTVTAGDMLTGFVTNSASASADGTTSNTDTETVNSPGADLSITKSDSPDPVTAGQTITYTLQVTNNGPSTANSLTVSDTLPAGVTYVSASGTGWSCSQAAGIVTCTRASLTVGAAPAITITVTAPSQDGLITNNAGVSSSTLDPVPANNSASATTTVSSSADLAISKSDNPDPVVVGQNLTYTLQVTNNGPSTANSLTVTDTLPAGVTYVSASGTGWSCSQAAGIVTCTRASLTVGAAPAIIIIVTAPAVAGSLNNTATVTSDTPDPNTSNNASSVMTTVSEPSLFDPPSGFKTVNSAGYPELVWRMVWINNGNAAAISAVITDAIPANTSYVNGSLSCSPQGSSSTDQCYFDGDNIRIFWQGTVAADPGALNETQAQNEVIITFRTTMNTSITRVENQGCAQIPGGATSCTDNPATPASGDPTVWTKSPTAVSVPTMTEWGFIILVVLQGLAALYYLRRRVRS